MDISLHLATPAEELIGRDAFAPPPAPLWAKYESEEMTFWLCFLSRDGSPVMSELRVVPTENGQLDGEWSRKVESVPEGGLDTTAIHNTPLGRIRDAAIALMSDPNHAVWEEAGFERWEQWWDTVAAAGIEATKAEPKPRGGGRPTEHTDSHWAVVAEHYVDAVAQGESIHKYIREQMSKGGENLPTENWVSEARKRGFLTPAPKPGKPGGTLTEKARQALKQLEPTDVRTDDETGEE